MTDNKSFGTIRGLLGKVLTVAVVLGILAAASYAQSGNLYYQSNGKFYGTVTVYNGSHYYIAVGSAAGGGEIKTLQNSCRPVNNGVAGRLCSFAYFKNGQHSYSGQAYFFQNGFVYLRWTNEKVAGNQWRQIDTGWYGFRP